MPANRYRESGQEAADERAAKKKSDDVSLASDMEQHTSAAGLGSYKPRPTATPSSSDPLEGLTGLALIAKKKQLEDEKKKATPRPTAQAQAKALAQSGSGR